MVIMIKKVVPLMQALLISIVSSEHLAGFYQAGTTDDGYLLSICNVNSVVYWGLTNVGSIFQYIEAVGASASEVSESCDEEDSCELEGTGYILGSTEYETISFTIETDSQSDGLTLSLMFEDSNLNKNIEFASISDTQADALFSQYGIDWGSYSCMVPFSAYSSDSSGSSSSSSSSSYSSDSSENEGINDEINDILAGIWLTDTIDDPTSPFDGWTDLELFSPDLTSDTDSCWAYFDENGDWRIGGSFFDFTTIDKVDGQKYRYFDELRLFLWEDIAVDETDSCRFGSELQVRIDEDVMLFTFLCSDQFVGGTSLIYRDASGMFDQLACPILVL